MAENTNTISQIQVGDVTYDIHDAKALPSNANATYALAIKDQSKESNILTVNWRGNIDMYDPEFNSAASSLEQDIYHMLTLRDPDGRLITFLQGSERTNGTIDTTLGARKMVNGSNIDNAIYLHVANDGTRSVSLSDRPAWLRALGYVEPTTLSLNSACTAYSVGQAPKYARDGHVVSVWGAVKPTAEVAAGGTLTIGTLPAGYRPSHDVVVLCQGSSQNKWALNVSTSGVLTASRYSSGATQAAMTTSIWLPFSVTFITTS